MIFVLAMCGAAAVCDWHSCRIPNPLLLAGLAGGLVWDLSWMYVVRALLILAALYPLYRLRMIGAGDIKLYSVLAGLLGFPDWVNVFFLSLFFAGLWSLYRMLKGNLIRERFWRLRAYITELLMTRRFQIYYVRGKESDEVIIPLAVPVFIAVAVVLLYSHKEVIMMWISA